MKIKIKENAIDINELKSALSEKFANEYQIGFRKRNILTVAKSKTIGALVVVKKDRIHIHGNFPSMAAHIIFTLSVVFLAILIPLLLYFLLFHKKMKAVEKEVGQFIKENYQTIIVT